MARLEENRGAIELLRQYEASGRTMFGKILQYGILPFVLWGLAQAGLLVQKNILVSFIWLFVIGALLMGPLRYYRDQKAMEVKPTREGYRTFRTTNQPRAWVVPLIMFVAFLLLILSGMLDDWWAQVMGNRVYGLKASDWSLVIAFVSSWGGMVCYYELLRTVYVRTDPTWKVILLSVVVPLLFILPMGLSIVKNFGA